MLGKDRGFTLVELMVVITIIVILSATGFVVYSGIQKSSRDSKRKADINSIVQSLETRLGDCASNKYCNLQTNYFSANVIPTDPRDGDRACGKRTDGSSALCNYCFLNDADLDYKYRGQNAAHNGCPSAPTGSNGTYSATKAQVNAPGSSTNYVSSFIICANLETASGSGGAMYYCKISQR